MAIDRLVFPEALRVISPRAYTPRKIGQFVMAIYPHLVWSVEPGGPYDVTPPQGLAASLEQVLHVYTNGVGTLRVGSGIFRIDEEHPVIVQTCDGGNNPNTSPIVGVLRYKPDEIELT